MNTATHYHLRGLGAGSQTVTAAGGTLMAAAPLTGPAAPFVALAGAVTELLGSIGIGQGCGQTCIVASDYANQAASLLQQNLDTYMALSKPRARSAQQTALSNFDQIWAGLVQACSNSSLGDAGKRCISWRQQGACNWKDSQGNCFNWFIGYRDPIANDTNVYDDSVTSAVTNAANNAGSAVSSALSNLFSGGSGSGFLLLAGGLFAAAILSEYL